MQRVQVPAYIKGLLQRIGRIARRRGVDAYAVGGCVRDWLLGITQTTDLDITVEGHGPELARAVAGHFGGTLTIHEQFGTATVVIRSTVLRVDFATCRREVYAKPAAYPRVVAGNLKDDLFRRDFTINAIAMSIAPGRFGTLIDPFDGVSDLRADTLRVLHGRSFLDDPSRILRGVRFAQRFDLRWERQTARAAREAIAAGTLGWLNAGRLHKELDRMCDEPDPRVCFEELASLLSSITDR